MRAFPLLALPALLAAALAGCSGGDPGSPPPGTGTRSSGPEPPPEEDSGVLSVAFESDGPATLEVPFPSLDSCRAPEDWMAGAPGASASNATAERGNASAGRSGAVLLLSGQGRVSWSVQIPLGPACQPIRADEWSTEPEPRPQDGNGTAEVRVASGTVAHATLVVRWVRGGCGQATLYEGTPAAGEWSALPGRSVPAGSC